jgi:hypothetical protein
MGESSTLKIEQSSLAIGASVESDNVSEASEVSEGTAICESSTVLTGRSPPPCTLILEQFVRLDQDLEVYANTGGAGGGSVAATSHMNRLALDFFQAMQFPGRGHKQLSPTGRRAALKHPSSVYAFCDCPGPPGAVKRP